MRAKIIGCVMAAAIAFGPARAMACAFHGYTPDPTLVDQLLATEQVVVARPTATGGYAVIETLLGPPVADLPITMGPVTGMLVKSRADRTVLLARDGAYGPWQEIAVMDAGFRSVIDQVMARHATWALGEETGRIGFFAARLNDPDDAVRRLALRELDRVSYASLRNATLPPVRDLRADLERGERDLLPIRVLLAGLSGDQGFAPLLWTQLDGAVDTDLPWLGAYVTALIELEGAGAVDRVFRQYLSSKRLPETTRARLLQAVAIQYRSAPAPTRRLISQEVAALLRTSPELRAQAVSQF